MKKLLLLFLLSPIALFSQVCFTEINISNANSIEYCITNASCHASCDGEITITVSGINQPYYFEWGSSGTPIANDNSRDSLCAGNYSVTITDNAGNLVDFQSNEIEEPSELGIFRTLNHPNCFNYSDGSIDVTTLGDSPFSWSWDNFFNTEDLLNLSSGEYILTTTDSNNCSRIDTFNLIDPIEVNSQSITDTLSCIGACDGVVVVLPNSGLTPYSFLWDDPLAQTTATATGLCYGLSTVYITDSMGCLDTNTVFIENPDTLKLSNITIDSACYQICDGEISVTIEGGTGPYNVSWSVGGVVFDTINTIISNLCPDVYEITYTDSNFCTEIQQIILNERDSFNLSSSVIDDSCFNSCTGQVSVLLLNPNSPPFIYDWDNGSSDSIASNLCSDSISLELIDARGCRDTFYYFVDEPDILSIDSVLVVNNTCYNDGTSSISVDVSGGTGTLSTLWIGSGGPYTTEDISNLNSGSYTLQIEDQNFCVEDTFFTITEPDSLFVTSSVQNVSCYNYSDGVIDVNIQGGTIPYTITWDLTLPDSIYIDSLVAGDYIYTISDDSGCVFQDTAIISQPDELIISNSITNVLCNGYHTGFIDLTITGGTAAYFYSWTGSGGPYTTQDLIDIGEGTYTVLVTDTKGCTENGTYIITEPQFPITSNIVGTDVLCNGYNTGVADLNISGGTTPYSFQWSNADTTEDISNLLAGTYTVDIIDENGCDTTTTINITESALISTTFNIAPVVCNGDSTGVINIINTSGGTFPYVYSFNNGLTFNSPTNVLVTAGQYILTVTDINLCPETLSLNVSEPSELVSSLTNTNITCYGYNNGSVNLTPSGGVGNYIFNWSNNESTEDIDNLSPGIYIVTLTDGNGCVILDSSLISEPTELIITSTFENSICNGEYLGSIDIAVSGGTGGVTFDWSNSETTEDLNNISAGNYTVDVIDANNCVISESFNITEPLAFLDVFNVTDVMCYGQSTASINFLLSGNTSPYTFSWSNGMNTQNIDYLSSGDYSVLVEDINNCSETFNVWVSEPEELNISYTVFNASCEENNDGSITTNVSGGTMPYAYQWSNGDYYSDLIGLSRGLYTLEVRDANSCVYPTQTMEVGFEGYDGCIEIPTGFTPNNDGIHDEWAIYGLYNFPDIIVSVHNRWGQKVFYSEGYSVPWDGKKNGVDLPIATYYYVIELKDSEKVFNGTVTIKR